jgi:hypothetical protein
MTSHASPGSLVAFEQLPNGLVNLPNFVTIDGFRPCITQFKVAQLKGPMTYIMLDSYALDEHPRIAPAMVTRFRRAAMTTGGFREVMTVRYVPTFLGISFPIADSPHDWRYPAHQISIYRRHPSATAIPAQCYQDLGSAIAALYRPDVK